LPLWSETKQTGSGTAPQGSKGLGFPQRSPGRHRAARMVGDPDPSDTARALARGNDEDEVDPLVHAEPGGLDVAQVVVLAPRGAVPARRRIALAVPGRQVAVNPAVPHEIQVLGRARLGVEVTRENGRLRHIVPLLDEEGHLRSLAFPHGGATMAAHSAGHAGEVNGGGSMFTPQGREARSESDARCVVKRSTGPLGWRIRA
jgi:hypothetical protein